MEKTLMEKWSCVSHMFFLTCVCAYLCVAEFHHLPRERNAARQSPWRQLRRGASIGGIDSKPNENAGDDACKEKFPAAASTNNGSPTAEWWSIVSTLPRCGTETQSPRTPCKRRVPSSENSNSCHLVGGV